MSDKLKTLDEQIEAISEIIQDAEYMVKATRVPKKKRTAQTTLNFWIAISKSLHELKELKA